MSYEGVHGAHAHLPGLRCTLCNVCSDGTNVNSLQQNGGISCFCRGRLVLSDPQYYDCMCPYLSILHMRVLYQSPLHNLSMRCL